MEEIGVVTGVKENGLALVSAKGRELCGSCHCQESCSAVAGGTERKITAINRAGAAVGDQVLIRIGSGSVLKASFVVYLLPILALVGGSFMGAKYSGQIWASGDPEAVSVLTGLFCLGASFILLRLFNRRLSQNHKYYPIIEEVIHRRDPSLAEASK